MDDSQNRIRMKIQIILFSIIIIALGCKERNESKFKNHTNNDSTIEQKNTTSTFDDSNFNPCYSDFSIEENNYKREVGIIGTFRGQNYFYEFWSTPSSNYLSADYIFLRTDTNRINNFDFCLLELGLDTISYDSLICKRLNLKDSSMIVDTTLTLNKIPGFKQLLFKTYLGWQRLSGLNKKGEDTPKLYFNDENLLLEYWVYENSANSWLIRKSFNCIGSKFKLNKTDTLQTVSSELNEE